MFGMSFSEILVIAVIAVLVLGPDKLPSAMVQIAKFLKMFKKGINDAKSTFDQEMKIAELKEDAQKYKESITQSAQSAQSVRKKLTFEELDEIKKSASDITGSIQNVVSDTKKTVENIKNPTNLVKDAILNDKKEA